MSSVSNSVYNHNPKSKSIQEKVFMFDEKKERNLQHDELERASFFTEATFKKFPEDYISRQSHADSHNYAKNETKERVANTSKFTGKSKESSSKRNLKTEFSGAESKLKSKVEMLEQELIETAAMEVGLYSIVAEHESSMNKVHAPARRLSRFYLHNSCKSNSHVQLGSASRAIISGLVLVSKSCGNDVPRLTFWLTNAIMLRAIISQAALKNTESDVWEDMESFVYALEKTESWIFSRIIDSIWWQTLTQYMQPTVAKTTSTNTKKSNSSKYGLGDQEKGSFSVELWNKAFKDACERICPIRSQGNECGCLSVMTRMIMERLVIRLDVAMFNAILRNSAEEMPSDPLSDPITEPRVLPIVAGKLSFGAGVQLKNAIGNWTRWLSDLFETDDECFSDETTPESFKVFRLLNALSDVMMLPFEMLTDKSTRKEVCPALGPALIKRVFSCFLPDQFCPYPIPQTVIDTLDSEDDWDTSSGVVNSHPCTGSPTVYSPPVVTSLKFKGFTLEVGNHNVTSDDELDEMGTNLNLIFNDSFREKPCTATKLGLLPKEDSKRKVVRYNLLCDIWNNF